MGELVKGPPEILKKKNPFYMKILYSPHPHTTHTQKKKREFLKNSCNDMKSFGFSTCGPQEILKNLSYVVENLCFFRSTPAGFT